MSGSAAQEFYGDFAELRESRDHAYHGRYVKKRQLWQDSIIMSVVERTTPQPEPWLVFTCGAMGAGKGYALGWMSSEGIFPLENIVHIDPDHFKRVMPEWKGYIGYAAREGKATLPGTMCHLESCFMQERHRAIFLPVHTLPVPKLPAQFISPYPSQSYLDPPQAFQPAPVHPTLPSPTPPNCMLLVPPRNPLAPARPTTPPRRLPSRGRCN